MGWRDASDEDALRSKFSEDVQKPSEGYEEAGGLPGWKHNLQYPFNWQAMKLLAAINGGAVSEYKSFAEKAMPFTKGSSGYFKMNLYPLSFKNTSPQLWLESFAGATGFPTKSDYAIWIKKNRFPVMKNWVEKYCPKIVLCVGKTYLADFQAAFVDSGAEMKRDVIDGHELHWFVNACGTLVVVIPFMVNANGLIKNTSIQMVGERIRSLLSPA